MRKGLIILVSVVMLLVGMVREAYAQDYSFPPVMQVFASSGLTLPYSAGLVTIGGTQQTILTGTLTLTDNKNQCSAPQFPACNIVYWNGWASTLSVTTDPLTAFTAGVVPIAYVTTSGGAVVAAVSVNLTLNAPDGATIPVGGILRLPLCTPILTKGCQQRLNTLSGY